MATARAATPVGAERMFSTSDLHAFAKGIFERCGMPERAADTLAEHLVWAEARGLTWLGLRKIGQYAGRLRAGGTSPDAVATVVHERGAFVALDAGDTFGQVVGVDAMGRAIDKAAAFGVGAAVVRNTTSAGALGFFAMMAADVRMIGLAINNSTALQAPWGGIAKAVGNQAFAIASPAGRHPPLLLDMATSAMSLARIHEFERRGESLPSGVALTRDGEPTTDPTSALDGILLPMGGHKGYGLAVMWEVLTGVLAGGALFAGDGRMPTELDQPQGTSVFLLAIDPTVALPYDDFVARVDTMIDRIHACPPAPGFDRVTVPGEGSHATAVERKANGIPVAADLAASLTQLGAELGVPFP